MRVGRVLLSVALMILQYCSNFRATLVTLWLLAGQKLKKLQRCWTCSGALFRKELLMELTIQNSRQKLSLKVKALPENLIEFSSSEKFVLQWVEESKV